jgi:hypothetical protein
MKVSVHLLNFTWPGGPQRLAQDLTRVAQAAEGNGFAGLVSSLVTSSCRDRSSPMTDPSR